MHQLKALECAAETRDQQDACVLRGLHPPRAAFNCFRQSPFSQREVGIFAKEHALYSTGINFSLER